MSGQKSITSQITPQQPQPARVPIQISATTPHYKEFAPQQPQAPTQLYYQPQQIQYGTLVPPSSTPPHDPHKTQPYMTSSVHHQQASTGHPAGTPGGLHTHAGAPSAPQGPVGQVGTMYQPRLQGPQAQYFPRPPQSAGGVGQPRPPRPQVAMNAPQHPQYPQYQQYAPMFQTGGQNQNAYSFIMMQPSYRPVQYMTQMPYVQQVSYPTDQWNMNAASYQPANVYHQPTPATQYSVPQPNRPPSGGQMYVPAQAPPTSAAPPAPREKKMIRITNPNTGEDIELNRAKGATPPLQAGSGSARATPSSSGQSNIAAQFAQQVAATLNTGKSQPQPTSSGSSTGSTTTPTTKPAQDSSSSVLPPGGVNDEPTTNSAPDSTSSTGNNDNNSTGTSGTQQGTSAVAATMVPKPQEDNIVVGNEEVQAPEVGGHDMLDAGEVTEEYAQQVVATLQSEQNTEKPDLLKEADVDEGVSPPPPTVVLPQVAPQAPSPVMEDLPAVVQDAEPLPPRDAEGKKSRKQRLKQLDEKAKAKEGSDMDLFRDSESAPSESNKASPPPEAPPTVNHVNDVTDSSTTTPAPHSGELTNDSTTVAPPNDVTVNSVDNTNDAVREKNDKNNIAPPNDVTKKTAPKKELKYNYKEDQWSPLNPEGKKQYDREFLLSLQDQLSSRTKPDNLPDLPDVILDKSRSNEQYPKFMPKTPSFDYFTPGYVKSTVSGSRPGPGSVGRRGSGQPGGKGSRDMKPPRVIEIVQPNVELHKAESSWTKTMKEKKREAVEVDDEEKATEELFRKVRGILNKLTPQKFAKLLTQIQALEINTEKRLSGVIDLIFEKAIDEPNFSVPYALLCKTLAQITVNPDTPGAKPVTFRVKLLARCQSEFQKDKAEEIELGKRQADIQSAETEEKKKELMILLEEAQAKSKRRSTGNIRFIGELFKLKMLTEKIMHECLVKLLDNGTEEDLECLCRLFTTIGKGIDTNQEDSKQRIDRYFQKMRDIIDNKRCSSRIKFLMLDVMDLRQNNWVPRRTANDPKTIDQIHKEAALEKEREALQEQQNQSMRLNKPKGQPRGPGTPGGRMAGDDGWTTVQTKNQNVDMSRMKLTKQHIDENLQLGPGFRLGPGSNWGRGSTGGSGGKPAEPENRLPVYGNRFSPLGGGSDPRNRGTGRGAMGPPGRPQDTRGRPQQAMGKRPMGHRGSQESERESALAAVRLGSYNRSISGGLDPRQSALGGGGSRGNSRENSRSRDGSSNRDYQRPGSGPSSRPTSRDASPREAPRPQTTSVKMFSASEMESKAKAILEEYLHIDDKKEALHCVSELQGQSRLNTFVEWSVTYVLERSESARKHTGYLLHDCVKQGYIPTDAWLAGVRSVTELGEDFEIDIPKIWMYLAELIGPMMEDGLIPMSGLTDICKPILSPAKRAKLAVSVLEFISHREGHGRAGSLWRQAGLQWSDFVPYQGSELDEFIKDNKLEYTTAKEVVHSNTSLSIDEIEKELKLMLARKAEDEEIFDWIEVNVGDARVKDPKFIRALMTQICSSAITAKGTAPSIRYEKTTLEPRAHVLQKYIDHEAELELQALYALQALVHDLEHPSGLLQYFFEELYDLEILSDEAFKSWMNSSDPAEQKGHAVAKKSVNPFLSSLLDDDDEPQTS